MFGLLGVFGALVAATFVDLGDDEEADPRDDDDEHAEVENDTERGDLLSVIAGSDGAGEDAGQTSEQDAASILGEPEHSIGNGSVESMEAPDTAEDAGADGAPILAEPGWVRGWDGADEMTGTESRDRIDGSEGDDALFGRGGDDHLVGSYGEDYLAGAEGNDVLEGGTGNDALDGGIGSDSLRGNDGDDYLTGGAGADVLMGDVGDDLIDGRVFENGVDRDDRDVLDGGAGNDIIILGSGDTGRGGEGSDEFVVGDWISGSVPEIADFDREEDRIVVELDRDQSDVLRFEMGEDGATPTLMLGDKPIMTLAEGVELSMQEIVIVHRT